MTSKADDFFPDIDPKGIPTKPDPIEDDWTDQEECPNCHRPYEEHKTNEAIFCAKVIARNSVYGGVIQKN